MLLFGKLAEVTPLMLLPLLVLLLPPTSSQDWFCLPTATLVGRHLKVLVGSLMTARFGREHRPRLVVT